jgi:hypothetical protein
VLHHVKTKVVYCKDVNRRGDFPVISFDFLGLQFRARKTMWRKGEMRIFTHSFQPAASPNTRFSVPDASSLRLITDQHPPVEFLCSPRLRSRTLSRGPGDVQRGDFRRIQRSSIYGGFVYATL